MDFLIAPNTVTAADADTAPATGTPGYATDGDPSKGTPRTPFPAYAWNAMQTEVATVITQAGITLNRNDNTLLNKAIDKKIAAGAAGAAVGFTPVEQGGVTGLTSDKINIGNSTNGLAAYIAGTYYGVLATQAWVTSKFVTNSGGTNGGIVSATIDGGTKTPSFQDGSGIWTQVASYSGLQAEISRATTVESNLQSSKYDKTGGTLSGTVTINGGGGLYVTVDPGGQTSGGYTNYGELVSQAGGRGGSFGFYVQEQVGVTFNGVIFLTQSNGFTRFLTAPGDASTRIKDSAFGDLAYTSDLENYQPKGDYAPASEISYGTITGGTYTKVGTILRQCFVVSNVVHDNTGTWVNYPMAFSNANNITIQTTCNANADMDTFAYGQTATGFYINIPYQSGSSNNPVFVTVEGYAG